MDADRLFTRIRTDKDTDSVVGAWNRCLGHLGPNTRSVVLVVGCHENHGRLCHQPVHEPRHIFGVRVRRPAICIVEHVRHVAEVRRRECNLVPVTRQHFEKHAAQSVADTKQACLREVAGELTTRQGIELVTDANHSVVQKPQAVVNGDVAHHLLLRVGRHLWIERNVGGHLHRAISHCALSAGCHAHCRNEPSIILLLWK